MFFIERLKFVRNLFKLWLRIILCFIRLHEKKETRKFNELPGNFEKNFYKSWAEEIDGVIDSGFQRKIIFEAPNENVRNHLLAATEFGQEIQSDIDLHITRDRLNQASFRRNFDPIAKSIIRNQNPLELVFKNFKHFDGRNPVIGSLIRKVDVGKKMI